MTANPVPAPEATPVEPRMVPLGAFTTLVEECGDRIGRFGQDDDELLDALVRLYPVADYELLSFDVFDTLLLRNDKPEGVRFAEMARRWAEAAPSLAPSAEDFLLARFHAAEVAYRTRKAVNGCREGHIDDILRMQARLLDLPDGFAAEMKRIELEYEAENLVANRVLLRYAELYRAASKPVILISDMYLDAAAIGELVRMVAGARWRFMVVHSSADEVLSKRAGTLYPLVAERFGVPVDRTLHVGDSLLSDVRQARAAGWGAIHFPITTAEHRAREARLRAFLVDQPAQIRRWAKL